MKILILLARVNSGFVFTIYCRKKKISVLFSECIKRLFKFIVAKTFQRKFKTKKLSDGQVNEFHIIVNVLPLLART